MNSAAEILVIILSIILSIFLILAIILVIFLIRVSSEIRRMSESARRTVDTIGTAVEGVGRLSSPLAFAGLIGKLFKGYLKKKAHQTIKGRKK